MAFEILHFVPVTFIQWRRLDLMLLAENLKKCADGSWKANCECPAERNEVAAMVFMK